MERLEDMEMIDTSSNSCGLCNQSFKASKREKVALDCGHQFCKCCYDALYNPSQNSIRCPLQHISQVETDMINLQQKGQRLDQDKLIDTMLDVQMLILPHMQKDDVDYDKHKILIDSYLDIPAKKKEWAEAKLKHQEETLRKMKQIEEEIKDHIQPQQVVEVENKVEVKNPDDELDRLLEELNNMQVPQQNVQPAVDEELERLLKSLEQPAGPGEPVFVPNAVPQIDADLDKLLEELNAYIPKTLLEQKTLQTFDITVENLKNLSVWLGAPVEQLSLQYRGSESQFDLQLMMDNIIQSDMAQGINDSPLLFLFKSDYDYVFGAYTSRRLIEQESDQYIDKKAFIFSFTNNTEHRLVRNHAEGVNYSNEGISFGKDIHITNFANLEPSNSSHLGHCYKIPEGISEDLQLQCYFPGYPWFKLVEFELYKVIYK
eukprot:403333617